MFVGRDASAILRVYRMLQFTLCRHRLAAEKEGPPSCFDDIRSMNGTLPAEALPSSHSQQLSSDFLRNGLSPHAPFLCQAPRLYFTHVCVTYTSI